MSSAIEIFSCSMSIALVLPERIVFGDEHRALEVRRNARVRDPDLVMTQRLAGLRGFALAQLR